MVTIKWGEILKHELILGASFAVVIGCVVFFIAIDAEPVSSEHDNYVATLIVAQDGTGHTDNLVWALDSVQASGGGMIFVKEGVYVLDNSLSINTDNVSIKGLGVGSELKFEPSADYASWWNENWLYRRAISLSLAAQHPDDYPIRIYIDNTTNLGGNLGLGNFDDLRFLENETSGVLSYWIENKVDSEHAIVWFKREDNSLDDNTIYIYYGNSNATNVDNAECVFGYDAGFDTLENESWTELDLKENIDFARDNSRLEINGTADAETSYVYYQLPTPRATFTLEWIWHLDYRASDGGYHDVGIGDAVGTINVWPNDGGMGLPVLFYSHSRGRNWKR